MLLSISMLRMQGEVPNPFRMLFAGPLLLFWLVLFVVLLAGFWKLFQKAGHPGWACLIPIYNVYILLKIAGRPGWWLILLFIPIVNVVINIIVAIDVAKAFGQSTVFGVVLNLLLCGIGYVILGFGNYQYIGPQGQTLAARA